MKLLIVILTLLILVTNCLGENYFIAMKAGRRAYQVRNYRKALAHFELAALFARKSPTPHLWRSQCLLKLNKIKAAQCCARKAKGLSPTSQAAKMLLRKTKYQDEGEKKEPAPLVFMEQAILDQWLRQKGFKEATLRSFGRYPIHAMALKGDVEMAKYLLRAKATIDVRDDESKASPLHWAILGERKDFLKFLIAEGVDLDVRNEAGESGLHYAASAANIEIAALLIAHGCPVDGRDRDGNSALHRAALTASKEFISFLLKEGADKELRNISEQRPYDVALTRARKEAAALLR